MRVHRRDQGWRSLLWTLAFVLLVGTGIPVRAAETIPPGFDRDLYLQGAQKVRVFRRSGIPPVGRREPFIMGTAAFDGTGREGHSLNLTNPQTITALEAVVTPLAFSASSGATAGVRLFGIACATGGGPGDFTGHHIASIGIEIGANGALEETFQLDRCVDPGCTQRQSVARRVVGPAQLFQPREIELGFEANQVRFGSYAPGTRAGARQTDGTAVEPHPPGCGPPANHQKGIDASNETAGPGTSASAEALVSDPKVNDQPAAVTPADAPPSGTTFPTTGSVAPEQITDLKFLFFDVDPALIAGARLLLRNQDVLPTALPIARIEVITDPLFGPILCVTLPDVPLGVSIGPESELAVEIELQTPAGPLVVTSFEFFASPP